MRLDLFVFGAPLLGVASLFFAEKILFPYQTQWPKILPIVAIQLINLALAAGLSIFLLIPLVIFVAPFQWFSFSNWQVPIWVSFAGSVLFLDFVYYLSHRLHHSVPALWRLHRLHHSDRHVNSFTTLLHHPLEAISGFFIVTTVAVIFDIPVIALLSYSALLGFHSAFTHVNFSLPVKMDKILRWFFITPNFHRVHHALDTYDSNQNFGSLFVFWDYLFRTFSNGQNDPRQSVLGIDESQSPKSDSIRDYLLNPFN